MLELHPDREELEELANKYNGDAVRIEKHYADELRKRTQHIGYFDWFEGRR